MNRFWSCVLATIGVTCMTGAAQAADIVLYASSASSTGNWSVVSDSTAAGGKRLASSDQGWSSPDSALASPRDYFELQFSAPSSTPYHVWVRLKAGSNSKYNDSLFLQFSDAVNTSGSAIYRIGSTSGLAANLQSCSSCSLSGWGWVDGAYWLSQTTTVQFSGSGNHTLRVQTREDGVSIDQIVLGPASAPGSLTGDSTVLSATAATSGTGGFNGVASLPGTVQAADYDAGGEGKSYHDTSSGNSGGAYRSDNVDIESSSDGGYNVGWTAAGEWLNYSVNVGSSGSYTAQLRAASPNGGTLHLGFNGSPNVWVAVNVPATGGWQSWTNVNVPVSLGAGTQLMTVMFDTSGVNLRYVKVSSGSTSSSGSTASAGGSGSSAPYGGSPVSLPGTVSLANFDTGGEGVAYHDTTSGNSGGAFRSGDVDIESCAEGGYSLGWVAAGEWLNYTVSVGSAGSYTAQIRVASSSGGTLHIGFNGPSSVWSSVSVPATGGWQSWQTINVPVSLGAGQQVMTVLSDSGGVNLAYVKVVSGTVVSSGGGSGSSGSSTTVTMADWNVQVDDGGSNHARVAMDLLLSLGPQPRIITIQEAHKSQFNTYIDELQNQTGRTWYGVFKSHCAPGAWNGSSCSSTEDEGVGIFSSYPIVDSSSMYLDGDVWHSARGAVRAALDVNGITVQVFSVHLQPDNWSARHNSMAKLRNWASQYARPQLIGGDFNAGADEVNASDGMGGAFINSFSVVGSGNQNSAFLPNPSMCIDFILSDSGGKATPTSALIPTSTGSWSDHRPVQTTFTIRP